jgi:hypothetical protein
MKILFLSNADKCDYGADCVYDGLVSILGQENVIDVNPMWYMRRSSFGEGKVDQKSLYGMGMTLYNRLDDAEVDRTDIVEKIKNKFFDYIVFASIQRCQFWFGGIISVYPPERIIMIDGEDTPITLSIHDKGWLFKRELCGDIEGMYPIHFGIPAEKILKERPEKTRFMSEYDPLVNRSYIFEDEASYYKGYADSYFAPTMRKAGFDALRHYEICSQWAIPYFRGIEAIPPSVMFRFPKKTCNIVRQLIEFGPEGCSTAVDFYERVIDGFMEHVRKNLTTESVARYILDTVSANK